MYTVSINERVKDIKNDENQINLFVEEYKPFIASCVEKAVGHYVTYGVDDELSIALMAFVEAIKSYIGEKGSFLSFAQNVIKRRLIDYYRKEKKHSGLISINEYYNEDGEEIDLSVSVSLDKYSEEEISEYRRLELEELKKELLQWDISFGELVDVSPKHDKTRKLYADMIRFLIVQPELLKQIRQKKLLPIMEIEKGTGIPRKKIERARKYILAVLIILSGDYQYVRDYIDLGVAL